jgi:lysozyme family protein
MASFSKSQKVVGVNEGGYQNDPRDSGNYYQGKLIGTNWGISAPVLASYLGRAITKSDMVNLSRTAAEKIFKINYWLRNNFDKLKNQSLATLIYDGAVNHGTNGMRMLVERALKVVKRPMSYYQVFTPKGIKHLNGISQKRLFDAIKKARLDKYRSSNQTHYINSWVSRVNRINYYSGNSFSEIWKYTAMLVIGFALILISIL